MAYWLGQVLGYGLFMLPALLPVFLKPKGDNRFGAPAQRVDFTSAFIRGIGNYATFTGRASRSEYWYIYLWAFLIALAINFAVGIAATKIRLSSDLISLLLMLPFGLFFLPVLSAGVRRLHDTNRSGLWLLLLLTGFGIPSVLVLLALPPQREDDARNPNLF